MDRTEKLQRSADAKWCHCFKHGMFARFYEHSLYWFSHTVKPLKPMLERVKGGEPVVYGGLPISSLEALIGQGALHQAETTEYGWKWPYAGQTALPPLGTEDAPEFSAWRKAVLAAAAQAGTEAKIKTLGTTNNEDVLAEIAAFNLAAHTPMQAMNAIARWQEVLRG